MIRGTSDDIDGRPERADDVCHLALDRLQRDDDLGDPLAGDVLEAARLVNLCRGSLQLRRRITADNRGYLVQCLAAFEDGMRRLRGVIDDRIQLIRGERNIVIGDIVHPQRGNFRFGDRDRTPKFFDLAQERCLLRREVIAYCCQHRTYYLRYYAGFDLGLLRPDRSQFLFQGVDTIAREPVRYIKHGQALSRSCP